MQPLERPDPYKRFDQQRRQEWQDNVPAVVHLDGSARLQTIPRTSRHKVAELLLEYERLTGIPLLRIGRANHHARGFFPDAQQRAILGAWSMYGGATACSRSRRS
ncbi:carbamoyltransferase C-terminal domain-containing protein [Bradyrhizobium sp. AS23.2]|uniref:carbamoyltransferase C-terminal domain-containing protein n=1 Tax=Bradyrhizobium sp. AS23.2 TaxID=1680155 RepID=UPI001FD8DA2C|nr:MULTISPECIES: carbamoyltransferase C-terminal domain-containing protein [unclassified Bradyrhizobium]